MSTTIFKDKKIILGVTGSIACYKAVDLASKLTQAGAIVDVLLTGSAQKFVEPFSFSSVTGRSAYSDLWDETFHVHHVKLGETADLVVVAPATAHTLAKMAHGLADNLLTVTILAARCAVMVAPAMDGGMYNNPATQSNLNTLISRGVKVVGPAHGRLASGLSGTGRMVEPSELLGHIRYQLGRSGRLSGRRFVVTAGPTQEPIDPVRFLSNRSSGKQGIALAQAAIDFGADVDLITGPVSAAIPAGVNHRLVRTAQEMHDEVVQLAEGADALLMAAAVADFRPPTTMVQKIKKQYEADALSTLNLEPTLDILLSVKQRREATRFPRVVVGFAAETTDIIQNGRAKLADKGLDFIAINDVGADDSGFAVDTNRVILLGKDGLERNLPLQSKELVAEEIVAVVASVLEG